MDDIFISYARDDRELVERLERKLEEFGYRCWFDRELTVGKEFREQITRRIENARCVIVAWSPHSASSPWVQDDADRAQKAAKLVSILVSPCTPPSPFETLPILDLTRELKSDSSFTSREGFEVLRRSLAAFGTVRSTIPEKPERKVTMSTSTETRRGARAPLPVPAVAAIALLAGLAAGAGAGVLVKAPSGGALPYSVSALPPEIRQAVTEARAQQLQAQKNADDAMKKAKAALYHANIARQAPNPDHEGRAIDPSAPNAFDVYYGEKLQDGRKSLGLTNRTLDDTGAPNPKGEHHMSFVGEHEGMMFGGFGVRVIDNTEYLQGQFRDGVPDGPGVLIQSDRSRYEGFFDKDKQDGFAVDIGPDGRVRYEGQWKSGERDGPGVQWNEDGCSYVAGVWSIGKIVTPKEGRLCKPSAS